ncbi:hypothetical protein PITCH_A2030111 [uncultured Desulfobacterium sp.]|uniref:N-acetyltransferase domain-containing protein n=1 Tax=uncultured Desulfobacterium sp. TaxID=201089 RepID=A0A445MWU9_9BACT|nr:hypothetical protein PITCH_A2030111 [uncultured Desulfobacterium sp.]
MNIRIATNQDRDDVQRVHMRAFPDCSKFIGGKKLLFNLRKLWKLIL